MRKKQKIIELFLAGILFGGITTGAQFLSSFRFSLYEISLFTLGLASLILLPFALKQGLTKRIEKRRMLFLGLYGLGGALLQLAGFAGIILKVPVAIVSFFMYSQPVWTVFLSLLFLGEKIDWRKSTAVASAVVGVGVLANLASAGGVVSNWAIIAPLIGGFLLSVWIVGGRAVSIEKEPASVVTFAYCFFTSLWLLAIYPIFRWMVPAPMFSSLSLTHAPIAWIHLLWIVVVSRVLSNWLFYRGMSKIEASKAGVIVLVEPISVAIISAIAFKQKITWILVVGGALILIANYLVITSSQKSTKRE